MVLRGNVGWGKVWIPTHEPGFEVERINLPEGSWKLSLVGMIPVLVFEVLTIFGCHIFQCFYMMLFLECSLRSLGKNYNSSNF